VVGSDGMVQTMSVIGNTTFAFGQAKDLDRAAIMEIAEVALSHVDRAMAAGATVAQFRAVVLRARRTSVDDFSRWVVR
jgi:hypothetical protein